MLLRTLAARRLSPSYLFEGSDAEGLREGARAFAAGILADAPPGPADARTVRLALAGEHPDLHELTKDKATVISVAALAPVLERAHSTPIESARQVFIVDPAEAMEPAGIARYLKSLEEPPESTVFILVTTRAERLPDTVLSRCRRVRFPPMPEEGIRARLLEAGVSPAVADRCVRAAGGSLGRARRLAEHGLPALADELVAAASSMPARVAAAAHDALAQLEHASAEIAAADESEADTKRQQLRLLVADVLRILAVEARECAAGRTSTLPAAIDAERALDLIAHWGRLEAAVAANVTPGAILIESIAALRRDLAASAGA